LSSPASVGDYSFDSTPSLSKMKSRESCAALQGMLFGRWSAAGGESRAKTGEAHDSVMCHTCLATRLGGTPKRFEQHLYCTFMTQPKKVPHTRSHTYICAHIHINTYIHRCTHAHIYQFILVSPSAETRRAALSRLGSSRRCIGTKDTRRAKIITRYIGRVQHNTFSVSTLFGLAPPRAIRLPHDYTFVCLFVCLSDPPHR